MINYIKDIISNPLKVTIVRNQNEEKEYGALESLLRSIFLPVESKKAIKELLRDILLVLLPILTFFVVSTTVVSGSMYPTIFTGDMLIASNIVYGGKFTAFPSNNYYHSNKKLIKYMKPDRGHIVILKSPVDIKKSFVKRIIGIPGDRIKIIDGIIHINGKSVKLKFIQSKYYVKEHGKYLGPFQEFEETLPNGISYHVIFRNIIGNGPNDNTQEFIVPKGCYFVMGDNRHESADSRSFFGFIEEKYINGRVIFVLLHHQHGILGSLVGNPKLWVTGFDISRIFKKLS